MTNNSVAFVGSIPENYDRYLGPVLFEPYADDLAERVSALMEGGLLELACGTGIVTRRLRDRFPASVEITATDLNEAMMNYAAQKFGPDENVKWKQADATNLAFADNSFDIIVCQFGLMFFPDKPKAMREVLRVLKPNGAFLFSVWDAIERNDLLRTADTIVTKYFDGDPPVFYQIPYSMHDAEEIRSLLMASGFEDIQISDVAFTSNALSAAEVAHGLIHGNPIIGELRERCESKIPEIEAEVAALIASRFGDNPVRAKMRALICAAKSPQ